MALLDRATGFLRMLPPERAHRLTLRLTRQAGAILSEPSADDERLHVQALGLDFPNPIGLAAGFDKDALVPAEMLRLGFGFVECGTLTPLPQAGNPTPRMFRLNEDRAVINRLGFNNGGVEAAALRLAKNRPRGIIGINIGANKTSQDRVGDYVRGFEKLARFASYVAINVSSPNTPGLRGLQNKDELERLLASLQKAREAARLGTPMLLKIAPDLDDRSMDDIASVITQAGIEGLIVSNTTIARPASLRGRYRNEEGGLSGAPLFEPSMRILREMRRRVGTKLVIIGVGGISSGADAYAKIRAGANLVQLYTALVFEGPGLIARIKQEILSLLDRDNLRRIDGAVGPN